MQTRLEINRLSCCKYSRYLQPFFQLIYIYPRSLNTLVTLIGGKSDNPTKFSIHKEFACRYSPVFNAAFNSGFIEGQTLEYRLDDVGETEIRMLIQWIYTQMICCRSDGDEYLQLVKLWVLADRLCIAPLQNAAFDKLYSIKLPLNDDDIPSIVSFVDSIYSITSSNSKMRQFVVAKCAFYIEPDDIRSVFRAFPYDFVVDYASYLHNRTIINKEIRRQGVSYYHTQ